MNEIAEQQAYLFDKDEIGGGLELNLANFSGPLDLLLELVKQNEIEIKDIFVSQVTEQFLQYMSQLSSLDVEKAGEYMATAATLLEIKSRALLPVPEDENDDDTPEKVFIRQLEEYKLFKEVCGELKQHETVERFYRDPDESVGTEVEVVKENLSIEGFMKAFNKFLMKMQMRSASQNVARAIVKESYSVRDKKAALHKMLDEDGKVDFFGLFNSNTSKNEFVTTFFAMLEVTRIQYAYIRQDDDFENIYLIKHDGAIWPDEEENDENNL